MLQKTLSDAASILRDAADDTTAQHIADIEIGKRIKKRRQQLRLSQTALGAAVGVSFQQIQKYVRIPMKPAIDSDLKPASHSDFIPAGVPI